MQRTDPYKGLYEFMAVAETLNFRQAAKRLGVSAPAVGKAIKLLERRLDIDLFHRTTRQVKLTDAGAILLARLSSATVEIHSAFESLSELRAQPSGNLRVCVHSIGLDDFTKPALVIFRQKYPDISLDVVVRDGAVDLLKGGFDLGIRIGELLVDLDMKAVKLFGPVSWCVVASPRYLEAFGVPTSPYELSDHRAIRFRPTSDADPYNWEFRNGAERLTISPPAPVVTNDQSLMLFLAEHDQGLAYTTQSRAREQLAAGVLVEVLCDFMPPDDSIFVHFHKSARRHQKVACFIDTLKDFGRQPKQGAQ
ncbi:LysR family transcriptional regulator [Mesorhizobium sp. M1329]|uniref:LysR family transcriptional regulator n=1 Tax=Mesorhizobium sp. M1329 TaxID=2957083 RepID=UPI0033368270